MEPITSVSVLWSLARRFWWAPIMLALIVLLVLSNGAKDRAKARLAMEQAAHTETKRGFEKTVSEYRAAAAKAQMDARANVDRVKAEQERLTEETVSEYKSMAAATAERYRLLQQRARQFEADTSGPESAGVSLTSYAACRAYAGTSCEEIPSLLNEAELNVNQLLALQKWVREQSKVKVTVSPAKRD